MSVFPFAVLGLLCPYRSMPVDLRSVVGSLDLCSEAGAADDAESLRQLSLDGLLAASDAACGQPVAAAKRRRAQLRWLESSGDSFALELGLRSEDKSVEVNT